MTRREALTTAAVVTASGAATAAIAWLLHVPAPKPDPKLPHTLRRIYRWEGTGYGWKTAAWMQRRMYELKPGDLICFSEGDELAYARVQTVPARVPAPGLWEIMIQPVPADRLPPGVEPCR